MNRDDIIRLAREAGLSNDFGNLGYPYLPELERFADLIVAAERQRKAWDATYWTAYEHDVAAAEREACAQIAHDTYEGFGVDAKGVDFVKQQIIRQIKERGPV